MVSWMEAEDWADEEYVYNFWDGYYNRATLWTDDYQEGTFYFYKIGEIGNELGNMLEDKAAYSHWFGDSNYGGK